MRMAFLGITLLFCAGCPSEPPTKEERAAARKKLRPECDTPTTNCWKDCFKRDASRYCPSCCFDQLILCNEQKPNNFEKCKQEP